MFSGIFATIADGLVDGFFNKHMYGMKFRDGVMLYVLAVATIVTLAYLTGFIFPDAQG